MQAADAALVAVSIACWSARSGAPHHDAARSARSGSLAPDAQVREVVVERQGALAEADGAAGLGIVVEVELHLRRDLGAVLVGDVLLLLQQRAQLLELVLEIVVVEFPVQDAVGVLLEEGPQRFSTCGAVRIGRPSRDWSPAALAMQQKPSSLGWK
jgi:hypothetical protein